MRIAVAEIAQETDSFTPLTAELTDFENYGIYYGAELLERMHGVGPIGGFLEVAAEQQQQQPLKLFPIVRAWGAAGGTITAATLDYLTERLVAGLRDAMPLDAIFLSMHGAAASENVDDVEGHILRAVRDVVGNDLPVVVPLDHHANVTQQMVDLADLLIGHETQPHDPPATGRKAARALFRMLRGESQPTVAWRKIPMITPQDQFLTSQGPMKEWFDLARSMEQREGVIDVSPYPMQPWLDVAEGGWSVVVHTERNPELAQTLAAEMANAAWRLRHQFWLSDRVAPADAVRNALRAESGLVILSDTGDSVYGGAPGDSACILRAMLEQNIPAMALVPLVDPQALQIASSAGVGAEISVELGGKFDRAFNRTVQVTGRVAAISKGLTVDLHDRGVCDLRRTALLQVGQIRIVLLDHRSFAINHPILYTHLGLEIGDAKMVVLKTASNFQFFAPWRKQLIRVDSPGTTQSNLRDFAWQRIPRPIFPLDDLPEWNALK
jgi:microcystin degradation protein MlrC